MSIERVTAIASNTMRDAIRSKVLYTLLFFAVLMIGTGVLISTLSYIDQARIMQGVGLGAIRIFGAAIAIFVGVGLVHKEVDRRTIYTILAKPISRREFLLGKFLGLSGTLLLQVAVMGAAFVVVSLLAGAPIGWGHMAALVLIAAELSLLVAASLLFSAFTTPMLASFFSAGIFVVGHLTEDLRGLGAQSDIPAVRDVTAALYHALPDLSRFNLTIPAVHGLVVPASDVWLPLCYGLAYTVFLLLLAGLVFERREFR